MFYPTVFFTKAKHPALEMKKTLRERTLRPVIGHDNLIRERIMVNEADMDFRIPGLPHSVVRNALSTSVRELTQKIENHPDRHALQQDLRQSQSFNSDQYCVSFQPILCHPHTQIRIILFHDEQRDIPNLEFSPIHVSIGLSQIAFPIIVLLNDDRTDSAQEEPLALPYWTMILAICVVVDESKCVDTPILEFSIISEHLPFSLGYKLILRLLLAHRNQAIWK